MNIIVPHVSITWFESKAHPVVPHGHARDSLINVVGNPINSLHGLNECILRLLIGRALHSLGLPRFVHCESREGVYGEIFRVLKPGGIFACYEWCLTDKYDPENATHRLIKKQIEVRDGWFSCVVIALRHV